MNSLALSSLLAAVLLSLGFASSADQFDHTGTREPASGAAANSAANCTSPCPYPADNGGR